MDVFVQDRCHRDHCKYFHPPPHIKEQLVTAGKQFGAMMSGCYPVPAYQPNLPVSTHPPPTVRYLVNWLHWEVLSLSSLTGSTGKCLVTLLTSPTAE